jgi:hypothetical protein
MNGNACTRQTLASSDHILIEQCSCGSLHVTIGAVTLRLASSAIASLAATFGDAARAMILREAFVASARANDVLS